MRGRGLIVLGILLFLLIVITQCGRDRCPTDHVWVMSDNAWVCVKQGLAP